MQIEIWQIVIVPVALAAISAGGAFLATKATLRANSRKQSVEVEEKIAQMAYRQCEQLEKVQKELEAALGAEQKENGELKVEIHTLKMRLSGLEVDIASMRRFLTEVIKGSWLLYKQVEQKGDHPAYTPPELAERKHHDDTGD